MANALMRRSCVDGLLVRFLPRSSSACTAWEAGRAKTSQPTTSMAKIGGKSGIAKPLSPPLAAKDQW